VATVVNATFASDAESFSAGSQVASEGAGFATGYLSVPSATTATKSFTAISSGVFRCDIWTKVTDTSAPADVNSNSFIYLLPTSGAVSSANSISTFTCERNATNANYILLYVRDSTGFIIPITVLSRNIWVKLSIVANFTSKTFDALVNDVRVYSGRTWANASASDFSRVVVLTQAAGLADANNEGAAALADAKADAAAGSKAEGEKMDDLKTADKGQSNKQSKHRK
jgi:hypothetical protein